MNTVIANFNFGTSAAVPYFGRASVPVLEYLDARSTLVVAELLLDAADAQR